MRALVLLLLIAGFAHAQSAEGRGVAGRVDSSWKPKPAFVLAGAASFGLLYLTNVVIMVVDMERANSGSFPQGFAYYPPRFDLLLIPFVGPFAAIGNYQNSAQEGTVVLLIVDGLAQLASATLFVIGLIGERTPERAPWLLSPGAAGAPAGATLTVRLP